MLKNEMEKVANRHLLVRCSSWPAFLPLQKTMQTRDTINLNTCSQADRDDDLLFRDVGAAMYSVIADTVQAGCHNAMPDVPWDAEGRLSPWCDTDTALRTGELWPSFGILSEPQLSSAWGGYSTDFELWSMLTDGSSSFERFLATHLASTRNDATDCYGLPDLNSSVSPQYSAESEFSVVVDCRALPDSAVSKRVPRSPNLPRSPAVHSSPKPASSATPPQVKLQACKTSRAKECKAAQGRDTRKREYEAMKTIIDVTSATQPSECLVDKKRKIAHGSCRNCGRTGTTPQLRRGPCGSATLCNACGAKLMKGVWMEETAQKVPDKYPVDLEAGVVYWPGKATADHDMMERLATVQKIYDGLVSGDFKLLYDKEACCELAMKKMQAFLKKSSG